MPVLNVRRHGVPKGAVVIMRPSKWGNRFLITPSRTREQVIEMYRQDLWARIKSGQLSIEELAALHGKDLVCCCKRSEEHTSELQSLMRISYAVFCLKKKNKKYIHRSNIYEHVVCVMVTLILVVVY